MVKQEPPASVFPQRSTNSYPQTEPALEQPRSPLKKFKQTNNNHNNKTENNLTERGRKIISFCWHHLLPQAGTVQSPEGTPQLERSLLAAKDSMVSKQLPLTSKALCARSTLVSHHPETGRVETTEMTRNKKEEQTALILVIQEEGPRFPVTRCAEDPSSFHHRPP